MVLNLIFGFLLGYQPAIAVTIFAIITLVLINIFYRILINQNNAKQLKDKTKELNKQMKEARKAGKKEESDKLMREMMQENSRLMRMTLKPMIISFIIVILLLPWLADAYGDRIVKIENNAGELVFRDVKYKVDMTDNDVKIIKESQATSCTLPCLEEIDGNLFEISKESTNLKFAPIVALLPISFPFVGNTLGWLGWYIFISIPLAVLIRRFMKIYV